MRALLEAAIADSALREDIAGGRVPLYRAFTVIWSSGDVEVGPDTDRADGEAARLHRIPPLNRQALLLTTLEEFSIDDAAEILQIDAQAVAQMVDEAIAEIEGEDAISVLIIEDEPLISMQLEALVTDLGHDVVATATTRAEAVEAFTRTMPGLVLADIQLADQSSGIDAVSDILAVGTVPVIFITAYPERLLTGERPEPTYLVTKPFREETVRAAISQALFFN